MNWLILTNDAIFFAIFGALAFQLLTIIELRNVPKWQRPDFHDPIYWLPFIISPIIGGLMALAYIYPNSSLDPIVAINVGVSAPLILKSMANLNPADSGGIDVGHGA